MTNEACESKLSFSCKVRDMWFHSIPGNWVASGRAVVYFVRAAHAFSAGVKCRNCRYVYLSHKKGGWDSCFSVMS